MTTTGHSPPTRHPPLRRLALLLAATALPALLGLSGCTEKPSSIAGTYSPGAYTANVQRLFDRSCTGTLGCHGPGNSAAGLELTSWEKLMAGSRYGQVVIADWPEESHLISHLTGESTPRMPLSRDPLPAADIQLIRDWVAAGACNDNGDLPFVEARRKVYATSQGNDWVSVIDADALVVSRIIDVDLTPDVVDSPHNVYIDRQGRYGYVTLINTGLLVQFDAVADTIRRWAPVGPSPAHPITSPDGSTVYVTCWSDVEPGVRVFDTETMTEIAAWRVAYPPVLAARPHGIAESADGRALFTANTASGSIARIRLDSSGAPVGLDIIPLGEPGQRLDPLQVMLDGNERHTFVTCNWSRDVRVVDNELGEVVAVIPLGGRPASQGRSPDGSFLYVCNWEENAIEVIDTRAKAVVGRLDNQGGSTVFAHPHAVAFSADGRLAFVTNENTNGLYPQHHPPEGGGRNGNVCVIDVATRRVTKVLEVGVFPTGIAFSAR